MGLIEGLDSPRGLTNTPFLFSKFDPILYLSDRLNVPSPQPIDKEKKPMGVVKFVVNE
jgi:hypothetical protein